MRARFIERRRQRAQGLSLLELLVAFAIMAIALGVLYRATGKGVRDVSAIEQRQRASWVMQSLLTQIDGVPEQGLFLEGQMQEFHWRIRSQPFAESVPDPAAPLLHEVWAELNWQDAGQPRVWALSVLRPQRGEVVPRP